MKRIGFALVTALTLIGLAVTASAKDWFSYGTTTRGSGNLVTKTVTVDSFNRIESDGAFDIYVKVGGAQSVAITFDDNLIDNVEVKVKHGELILKTRGGSYSAHDNCKVEVTVPAIEEVYVDGSGDVDISNLSGDQFVYEVSGSGDFRADGTIKEIQINISGSGDVDTRKLKAESVRVEINGSGDAMVFATESIEGEINGSGDIRYYGKPASRNIHVSGSGSMLEGR